MQQVWKIFLEDRIKEAHRASFIFKINLFLFSLESMPPPGRDTAREEALAAMRRPSSGGIFSNIDAINNQ